MKKNKGSARLKRKLRIRKSVSGTAQRPRVTVFRSNVYIYVQAIDDVTGKVMASSSDMSIKKGTKTEKAQAVGEVFGAELQKHKIDEVVFDRNGYKYHGRIKALADGARSAGLKF